MDELFFFFFNDTATTEIYTLSLHDALPISSASGPVYSTAYTAVRGLAMIASQPSVKSMFAGSEMSLSRSEEHTSELQSRQYLVCRLLLEKKKITLIVIKLLPLHQIIPQSSI